MHSTDDEIVYPQQSKEMAWDLAANNVPHQLVIVDGGGHQFDNPGEHPTEAGIAQAIIQFFVRTLVYHQPLDTNPNGGTGPLQATPSTGNSGNSGATGTTGTTGGSPVAATG
jgi:hypothetical protein